MMQTVKTPRTWSFFDYFSWLSVIAFIFTVIRFLKATTTAEFYGMSGLGVAAGFGLSALYASVPIMLGALVLWSLERLGQLKWLLVWVARGCIFIGVVWIWMYVLRRLYLDILRLPPFVSNTVYSSIALVGALVVFVGLRDKAIEWLSESLHRVKATTIAALVLYVCSAMYLLFIEPLNFPKRQSPVVVHDAHVPRPNVFIIILDALSARDMALYGYSLQTAPNLSRIAHHWTVYENAHACGTGTLSSMPCILTGRYAYTDQWSRYGELTHSAASPHWISLPDVLRAHGYHTVYASGGGYSAALYGFHHDFDRILSVGKDYYLSTDLGSLASPLYFAFMTYLVPHSVPMFEVPRLSLPMIGGPLAIEEPLYRHAADYFRSWSRSADGQPIFAYMHMLRPHRPYVANEFTGQFLPVSEGLIGLDSQSAFQDRKYQPDEQEIVDKLRLRYNENILKADQSIADLIQAIQEAGLYDNALIIVTGDHGTNFSSGYYGYYTPVLSAAEHHVPLLVKYPFQKEGRRISGLASHVDILPTVLEGVGVTSYASFSDGQPLSKAGEDSRRVIYVRRPNDIKYGSPVYAAIGDGLKLVHRVDGLRLYDLSADPTEKYDLLGTRDVSGLMAALDSFRARQRAMQSGGDLNHGPPLLSTVQ